jgi:hypothetical protein
MSKTNKKASILGKYARLAKSLRRDISLADIQKLGVTRDMISHHFGSLSALDKEARETHPDKFFDVSVDSLYSPKSLNTLRNKVDGANRFVITTAVNGCEVHNAFYASLQNYCKVNKAQLLIVVSSDPASNLAVHGRKWGTISAKLQNETIVLEDTRLNSNVFISTIKLSAKSIDPTTGLGRIGQRNGTFIYASPKQRLRPVPTSNTKLPHFLMTTGAITEPNYNTELYMSQRTAYIAENDHVLGAVVVEVVDDQIYHFRQIQANAKGKFYDLGKEYSGESVKDVRPEAFVLGDWHSGSTDPDARRAWEEISLLVKPKRIILHDAFDGLSINHHEDHQQLLKAKRAEAGQLSLGSEIKGLAEDLSDLLELTDELVVVKSNHDVFLERYLQSGKYVEDHHNHRLALKLASAHLDGHDPIKFGVAEHFKKKDRWNKVTWLRIDNDYKIEGIQCGAHGHLGSNGARGSLQAMEAAYGNSVSGHTHSPEILRGAWQVGTSSLLKLEYNRGASSWLHSSCLIYPGGSRQLINAIEGDWRLQPKRRKDNK